MPIKTSPLRIAFMGSADIGLPTLKKLLAEAHTIVAIYTQPPRPKGRGHKLQKTAIHQLAEEHQIPVYTPTSLKVAEAQEQFQSHQLDLALVFAYGLILPKLILDAPVYGCLNMHVSLLPRWRGAAPIQHAIWARDTTSGLTIMKMDEGLDTGPILYQTSVPLTDCTTADRLHNDLSDLSAKILPQILEDYTTGQLMPTPQPTEGITLAPKIKKEDGLLDWQCSALEIDAQIRALNPWPGASFSWQGTRLKALEAKVIQILHSKVPGTVLDKRLTIACGQQALRLLRLQLPGRPAMAATAFLNGHAIPKGTRFEALKLSI